MNGPASLRFRNQEFREGFAEGRVRIGKAADESDVAEYVLYWGTSADLKAPGDPIAVLPRGPEEHVFMLAPGTPIPAGATHLLAFTRNAKGEGPHVPASLANAPQFIDLSALLPADADDELELRHQRVRVDAARKRLLVVGESRSLQQDGMGTLACDLDATACTFSYVCTGDDCAMIPNQELDDLNDKLLIAGDVDADDASGLVGWVCARDGTACEMSVAPGQWSLRGSPSVFFRPETNDVVLLYLSNEGTTGAQYHLHATMCSADFARCPTRHVDLTPGEPIDTFSAVRLPNGKFAVAATSPAYSYSLRIILTDGTPQGTVKEGASLSQTTGVVPAMAVDTKNERLVIVTTNRAKNDRLYLTICPFDGKNCTSVDIGADAPEDSGRSPSVAIDYENEKLLVLSNDGSNMGRPRLTRCNLDGTACRTREFAAGQLDTAIDPTAVIDPVNGYLLVVTNPERKVGLIRWGL